MVRKIIIATHLEGNGRVSTGGCSSEAAREYADTLNSGLLEGTR